MIWVYLAALVVGAGILLLQAVLGHEGADGMDADGDGVPDSPGHDGDSGAPLLFSARFWIFLALAFGLSGALLTLFQLASSGVVLALAAGSGVVSGLFAAAVIRALKRGQVSSVVSAQEAVGRLGAVLVQCEKGRVGKIRLELRGQTVDLLAMSNDSLPVGTRVLIEDIEGDIARVIKAPDEIAP